MVETILVRPQFDFSNSQTGQKPRALVNGGAFLQQARGVLETLRADGSSRFTDLRPMSEQIGEGPLHDTLAEYIRYLDLPDALPPFVSSALITAEGSTSPRTLAKRFAESVNVKDFGAVGNGIANDTAAWLDADDKALERGVPIAAPPGTYSISGLLGRTNAQGATLGISSPIIGLDARKTTLKLAPTVAAGAGVAGIKLAANLPSWSMRGITVDNDGRGADNLFSQSTAFLDIQECRFLNAGLRGIYAAANGRAVLCHNFVQNSGSGPNAVAVSAGSGISVITTSALIQSNTILNTGGAGIACLALLAGFEGYILICDNYIVDSGSKVIQDNITAYDSINGRTRVFRNWCQKSGNHNIHIGGNDTEVVGNYCFNAKQCNIYHGGRDAGTINFVRTSGGKVSDNVCDTTTNNQPNIRLDQSDFTDVTRNRCRNASGPAIFATVGIGVVIADNPEISNPGSHGISVTGLTDSRITGNTIRLTNTSAHCVVNQQGSVTTTLYNADGTVQKNPDGTNKTQTTLYNSDTLLIADNSMRGGNTAVTNTDALATLKVVNNSSNGTQAATQPYALQIGDIAYGNTGGLQVGLALGVQNSASGTFSEARGNRADSKQRPGFFAFANGMFSLSGDAQSFHATLRGNTGTGTSVILTSDGDVGGTRNMLNLNVAETVIFLQALVEAKDPSGNVATWLVEGCAKNAGGTLTLVGTPTVTAKFKDTAAASWNVLVTADDVYKTMRLTLTNAPNNTRAVAQVRGVEMI